MLYILFWKVKKIRYHTYNQPFGFFIFLSNLFPFIKAVKCSRFSRSSLWSPPPGPPLFFTLGTPGQSLALQSLYVLKYKCRYSYTWYRKLFYMFRRFSQMISYCLIILQFVFFHLTSFMKSVLINTGACTHTCSTLFVPLHCCMWCHDVTTSHSLFLLDIVKNGASLDMLIQLF